MHLNVSRKSACEESIEGMILGFKEPSCQKKTEVVAERSVPGLEVYRFRNTPPLPDLPDDSGAGVA